MIPEELLRHAARLIAEGRLVAFPTETVYGLGANALDAHAVERIYQLKGRPGTSPLIVHVDGPQMARTVVRDWPPAAQALAARYWPGPLTLVLPKQAYVPDRVTAGLDTVGVRVPAHPVALALISAAGVPVAAPSANRFMELSPTTAEHVRAAFGTDVDLILDGGRATVGIESTVLSLAGSPVLLRPGMVSHAELEAVIGPVQFGPTAGGTAHAAPGMHPRHYAPRTPLRLGLPHFGKREAYIWWSTEADCARAVRMPAEAAAYASRLYLVLHELDAEGWDAIVAEPVPEGAAWAGVADRLKRAATT